MHFLAVGGIALLLTLLLTPLAGHLGRRLRLLDTPGPLAIHPHPVPRSGGWALFLAFLIAIAYGTSELSRQQSYMGWTPLRGILVGSASIVLIGTVDDRLRLPPLLRFALQLLAGAIAIFLGLRVTAIPLPWLAGLLTLFYLVSGANSMNLLDGMNGIASGVTAIAAVFLAGLALHARNDLAVMLSLGTIGVCLGFLPYNYPKGRIFLGDGGSLFLGFVLVSVAVLLTSQPLNVESFVAPLWVLGLPIFDTFLALVRRILRRQNPFLGDRYHVYDLLHHAGHSPWKVALLLYAAAAVLGVSALTTIFLPTYVSLGLLTLEVCLLLTFAVTWNAFNPKD